MAFGFRVLAALITVWYSFSLLAIVSAKVVLNACPCAATLCALQLGAAVLGCQLVARLTPPAKDHDRHGRGVAPLATAEFAGVCAVAASYSSGFAFTNAAIEFASPSFVETVKSSEPMSTVALAAVFLGERESRLTLLSLLPIVIGVAMASGLGEGHLAAAFSAIGMALALASNVSFSARAVATKSLLLAHPHSALARDPDLVLFYHVSRIGLLLLLPIAGLLDVRVLINALLGLGVDGSSSSSNSSADSNGSTGDERLTPQLLLLALAINGASHALYNAISFAVLNRVSVATHAVLNIVHRVVMIAGTALIFQTPIDPYNWLGILICVLGCLTFAHGKQSQPARTLKSGSSPCRHGQHGCGRLHEV